MGLYWTGTGWPHSRTTFPQVRPKTRRVQFEPNSVATNDGSDDCELMMMIVVINEDGFDDGRLLFRYPFHPRVTEEARKRPRSVC